MGGILELVQWMKEPSGMIVGVLVVVAVYFYVKWLKKED